jgi:uncharacterized protein DUF4124
VPSAQIRNHLPHDHLFEGAVLPVPMKLRSEARRAVRALVCCLVWVMACLVFAGPASSADVIYKYEDEQGVPHYTDRRDLIPEKYRSKAKVLDSRKAPVTVVPTPPSPPPAPGERPPPSWLDQITQFASSGPGLTMAGVLLLVMLWRFFRS